MKNIISLIYGWILFITFIVITTKKELVLMFGDQEEYENYLLTNNKKETYMKKFLVRIRQFLKNFFGYQNTEEIRLQTAQIENSSTIQKAMTMDLLGKLDMLIAAMNKNTMENLNGLNSIFNLFSQRPIVPLIMNDKGYLLNLAVEKKMKMECTSDGDIVFFKIIVDHTHTFMNVDVNLQRICIENLNTEAFKEQLPVMQHARVMLKNGDKKSGLLDRIALIAMSKLTVRAQHQMVDQKEAFYLFADTILGVVKPIYEADLAKQEAKMKANENGTGINQIKVEFPDNAHGRKAKEKFEKETGMQAGLSLLSDEEKNGIPEDVNIQEHQNDNILSQSETERFGSTPAQKVEESKIN